jgi:hypothetical protein
MMAKLLSLVTLLFLGCLEPNQEDLFDGKPEATIRAEAWIMSSIDSISTPQKMDTIQPGDSVYLQWAINSSRGIPKTGWTIDGVEALADLSIIKWAFPHAGRHVAIFSATDRFGDILRDTVVAIVNSTPRFGSHFVPKDSSWNVPISSTGGLAFEWEGSDPDTLASISSHFTLTRLFCANGKGDTLLSDTVLSAPRITWWEPLEPLCNYRWSVSIADEFGIPASPATVVNFFSSGTLDGSGALEFHVGRKELSSLSGLVVQIQRLGSPSPIEVPVGSDGIARLIQAIPGEYRIRAIDGIFSEYRAPISTVTLHTGEYLRPPAKLWLKDTIQPEVHCYSSNTDSMEVFGYRAEFSLTDNGSGIDSSSTLAFFEGIAVPFTYPSYGENSTTLQVAIPLWAQGSGAHPLEIRVNDKAGNSSKGIFWITLGATP